MQGEAAVPRWRGSSAAPERPALCNEDSAQANSREAAESA
jgi:hypothetical protein